MITKHDVEVATHNCLAKANAMFDTSVVLDSVTWEVRGKTIGQAGYQYHRYFIRYNEQAFAYDPEQMLRDTVPHEVAHLIVYWMQHNGRHVIGKAHGRTWKRVCAILGGNLACTTDAFRGANLRVRHTRQFEYRLDSGYVVYVGATVHRRMQMNPTTYRRRILTTGERFEARHFTGRQKLKD